MLTAMLTKIRSRADIAPDEDQRSSLPNYGDPQTLLMVEQERLTSVSAGGMRPLNDEGEFSFFYRVPKACSKYETKRAKTPFGL